MSSAAYVIGPACHRQATCRSATARGSFAFERLRAPNPGHPQRPRARASKPSLHVGLQPPHQHIDLPRTSAGWTSDELVLWYSCRHRRCQHRIAAASTRCIRCKPFGSFVCSTLPSHQVGKGIMLPNLLCQCHVSFCYPVNHLFLPAISLRLCHSSRQKRRPSLR